MYTQKILSFLTFCDHALKSPIALPPNYADYADADAGQRLTEALKEPILNTLYNQMTYQLFAAIAHNKQITTLPPTNPDGTLIPHA